MSHVVKINFNILSLDALATAAQQLGMELVRGQQTYKWWGQSVGDYPLPEGFTAEDLGKCDHAVRLKGDADAYEIGVVRNRTGKGYTLVYDFYGHAGRLLEVAAGASCAKLRQEYSAAVTIAQAARMGMRARRRQKADGTIEIVLSR